MNSLRKTPLPLLPPLLHPSSSGVFLESPNEKKLCFWENVIKLSGVLSLIWRDNKSEQWVEECLSPNFQFLRRANSSAKILLILLQFHYNNLIFLSVSSSWLLLFQNLKENFCRLVYSCSEPHRSVFGQMVDRIFLQILLISERMVHSGCVQYVYVYVGNKVIPNECFYRTLTERICSLKILEVGEN